MNATGPSPLWRTTRFRIDLSRPQVMGIVNVTPDSFSDGGQFAAADAARQHCEQLLAEGADLLDIGAESTRPGARSPGLAEERERLMPVLRHAVTLGIPVSVDTSRPELMAEAIEIGADIVNDVRALLRPGALEVLAQAPDTGVCLMHMQGEPGQMQVAPHYDGDVLTAVVGFLRQRLQAVHAAGVALHRIVLDPGIGFGKLPEHNWALLQGQQVLLALGQPLLLGWSRKSTLGQLTGRAVDERQVASVAAALACVQRGGHVLRVHDVAAMVDALKVWRAAGLPGLT